MRKKTTWAAVAAGIVGLGLAAGATAQNINAVFYAEVTTLDPHFAATYNTRSFGYLVYDTLFAMDSKGVVRPQMVKDYEVSPDRLKYRFTLRDGLAFHSGEPLTAADCVASLKRWGSRDALGRRLFEAIQSIEAHNDKTFTIVLKRPFGLVLEALGKPSSLVPFIMPARLASKPASEKLTEVVGSGPFVFKADLWKPGERIVVEKNARYVPRAEPADFLAGGKVVKVDRVTLRVIPDPASAAAALRAGEIDYLENASFDLLPVLERDPQIVVTNLKGEQMAVASFVLNHRAKPFDDEAIRQVMWKVVDQREMLDAIGIPKQYGDVCKSYFLCGTALSTMAGTELATPSLDAARAALKATKYNGETVTILQASDIASARIGTEIVAERMRKAGFKVDLQTTDWGTILAKRAKPENWSMYASQSGGFDLSNPLTNFFIGNNCTEYPGWNCQQKMTALLTGFAGATSVEARKQLSEDIHRLAYQDAGWIMFATFSQPNAYRKVLKNLIPSGIPVFWNVEKTGK